MKRFIFMLVLLYSFTLVFASCAADNGGDSLVKDATGMPDTLQTIEKAYTIALVMKTLTNPFFVEMEKGARKAESEFGVELLVRTGAKETSIEQQIQIVEELIAKKVDAIVIAPGSSTELVPVLKKAQDAGIKIVNIDNRLDEKESMQQGLKDIPFISVKNDEGAYLSVKEITKNITSKEKAIILEGIRDAENAKLRKEGALKAFGENANIEIVASESAEWKIDETHDVFKSLFEKNPDVELVFCANDMMALGAIQYLKKIQKKDVLVAGFDNLEDARNAIKEGWMTVTIDQQADIQGYKGVETAVNLLKGLNVEKETYVPVKVITVATLK